MKVGVIGYEINLSEMHLAFAAIVVDYQSGRGLELIRKSRCIPGFSSPNPFRDRRSPIERCNLPSYPVAATARNRSRAEAIAGRHAPT